MKAKQHKMSIFDFMPTIKGIFIAAIGWTIASIQSFSIFSQFTTSTQIEMWDAWISIAIKGITLITGIVLLFYNINKLIKQNSTMVQLTPGGDNEDGSGSDIDPDDPDQEG